MTADQLHDMDVPRERFIERGPSGHEARGLESGRPGSIWNQAVTQVAATIGLVIGIATLISALSKRRR